MLSTSPLATRTHRALRKGVIVGSAVVVGMLLVELSRELFGHGHISLLAYLLYPGVALVQAVPGWDLFIGHSVIPGLFVDLFLYSAGATLWFVAGEALGKPPVVVKVEQHAVVQRQHDGGGGNHTP